jgi:hypothetical protein
MIVWRGRGGIVAAVAFSSLLVSELACRGYFQDDRYYQQHGWPKLVGFFTAAGVVWLLQRNERPEYVEMANRQNVREPILRSQDSLFFVSARFWPLILCCLGMIFYFFRE